MKTSTVVKVSILVIYLCLLLFIPVEAFSDNTSFFQQDKDWGAFVGEINAEKGVVVFTSNPKKMSLSFVYFKDRSPIQIIGEVSSNVTIDEINLNCDISVDNNNVYYAKVIGGMGNKNVYFKIYK